MHRFEKITFEPVTDYVTMPLFKVHTIECPKCHLRHPVPIEYTDWKAVAEMERKAYNLMAIRFMHLLQEAAQQFDVPLVEYFETERQVLMAELRSIVESLRNNPKP